MIIEYVTVAIFLLIYSYMDAKYHRVYLPLAGLVIIFLILCMLFDCSFSCTSFYGVWLGILFFVFSIVTKERLGVGDAVVFLVLGMVVPVWDILFLFMIASVEVLFYAAIKGIKEVPMIPFLCVTYIIWLVL